MQGKAATGLSVVRLGISKNNISTCKKYFSILEKHARGTHFSALNPRNCWHGELHHCASVISLPVSSLKDHSSVEVVQNLERQRKPGTVGMDDIAIRTVWRNYRNMNLKYCNTMTMKTVNNTEGMLLS